jgi:hypothetical protein
LFIRKFAAVGIATALLLGTSACGAVTPIASLETYAPSDGVEATFESIKVRNFIYLSDGQGNGALFGSVVNSGLAAATLKLQYNDAETGEKRDEQLSLLAGQKRDLGYNGSTPLAIKLAGKPGQTAEVWVAEGSNAGVALNVPILDGTLAEYESLLEEIKNLGGATAE